MGNIKTINEITKETLESLQEIIKVKNLQGPEVVEFVKEFTIDLNEALEIKLEKINTEWDNEILHERLMEWEQESREDRMRGEDPDEN